MSESLTTKTISNISCSAIGKIVSFVFQAVTNVILSRELGASDYGVVGFALILVSFLKGFGDLGINTAAIQRKEMDERALNTAFTLRLTLGAIIYCIAFIIAGFAPIIFNNPSIVLVIRLLALNIILYTLAFIPGVILSRSLKFKYIVISETILSVVSSIIAIGFALNGFKFWSIVAANIFSNVAFVAAMNYFSPNRMRFCLDKEIAREYLKYGSKIFLSGLLAFAVFNLDNFIIGAISGDKQLGYYIIAFNWGSMICLIMTSTVYNVLFPTLSTIQGDTEKSVRAYVTIIEYVALSSILFNAVLFCVSQDFLVYVLGKGTAKWMPSLMALKILCAYGVARALLEAVGTFFTAKGLAGTVLKANLLVAVLELIFVYPAVLFGSIEVVALVVFIAYLTATIVYIVNLPHIGLNILDLWRPIQPAIISLSVSVPIYFVLAQSINGGILSLLIRASIVTSLYLLTYSILTKFKIVKLAISTIQTQTRRSNPI